MVNYICNIPVATADELDSIRSETLETYGKGTKWEDKYTGGLDKKYVQVKDIDLSGYSEGEGWNPISIFTGTYDGGNYVITDLEINLWENYYQGLFGYTKGATINNVGLIDNKVTGSSGTGGLVGRADSTVISNSYATGTVTGFSSYVGGLVGWAENSTMIRNSYATGTVTGKRDFVGGLVGRADSTVISNSYATGTVTRTRNYESGAYSVGGLVGEASSSKISNSYATGTVAAEENGIYIGGLVGNAWESTIENSYATGSVKGNPFAGGLVGLSGYTTISNSYATGSVDGYYAGGLVASTYNDTIENSYWDTVTTKQSNSAKQDASFGKTTEEMKLKETYKDWDFDTVWEITPGNYPTLK